MNSCPPLQIHIKSPRFIATFIVTAMLFALGQFHRSSGSILSSVFAEQFSLQPEQIGFVIGIMFIAQAMAQIPSGVLIDRYGSRKALSGMSMLAALGCILVASAHSWTMLIIGRALIGIGFSAAMMGSFRLFAFWVPSQALTTLTGRYMFFGLLGGLLATTPLTLMLDQWGWRTVFLIFGIGTATVGGIVAFIVRDTPPGYQRDTSSPPETLFQVFRGIATILRKREIWPILLAAPLLYTPSQILLGLWAAPYLADVHDLTPLHRSYCLMFMVAGMSLGAPAYGFIDRRSDTRRRVMIGGALTVASAFLALSFVGQTHWIVATALSGLICGASTFFLLILGHAQLMFTSNYSGRVVSTIGVISLAGVFVTQIVSAIILGQFPALDMTASLFGYQVLFALMAGASVIVAFLCSRLSATL
ncbi:MFS transporter [Rhodobacteraceae bacterium KMM 6894]|nr:MFS transporter [Rhodobacteraceae bacterium KMM 6894]